MRLLVRYRAEGAGMAFVSSVTDGDGCIVQTSRGSFVVRLWGIDAPEINQRGGHAAREQLRRLAEGKRFRLLPHERDRYGRTVADLEGEDGARLSVLMVRSGWAWWFKRFAWSDNELREAQEEARADRRGLWQDEKPTPPWQYRRRRLRL